jgi:hypothetical protein
MNVCLWHIGDIHAHATNQLYKVAPAAEWEVGIVKIVDNPRSASLAAAANRLPLRRIAL